MLGFEYLPQVKDQLIKLGVNIIKRFLQCYKDSCSLGACISSYLWHGLRPGQDRGRQGSVKSPGTSADLQQQHQDKDIASSVAQNIKSQKQNAHCCFYCQAHQHVEGTLTVTFCVSLSFSAVNTSVWPVAQLVALCIRYIAIRFTCGEYYDLYELQWCKTTINPAGWTQLRNTPILFSTS